jgi:hypothetical protein
VRVDTVRTVAARLGVPAEAISIGGPGDGECYVVERVGDIWSVYYADRGDRAFEQTFHTEADACRYLIGWLVDDVLGLG